MRIIAGTARGRPLEGPGPKAQGIRPTSDKVRGAIFNILGQWMDDLNVLDLYAGTGAFALEALSRRARHAVLVDASLDAVTLCRKNAEATGFARQVDIWRSPADRACEKLGREGRKFELIFADPPYAAEVLGRTVALVEKAGLLAPGGVLVVEHHADEPLAPLPEGTAPAPGALTRTDLREFGDTAVSFFAVS